MADSPLPTSVRAANDGVRHRNYRERLQSNGIRMLRAHGKPPQPIQAILLDVLPVEPIAITGRAEVTATRGLAISGADETQVKRLFEPMISDRIDTSRLKAPSNTPLDPLRVPNRHGQRRIVTPKPDIYLGYDHEHFEDGVQGLFKNVDTNVAKLAFLNVELKGDGETSLGGLWVATNQCMGGASTFLNILNKLQSTLLEHHLVEEANAFEPVIFSIASNGTEARLFATYSQSEGDFTTYFVRGFLLYDALSRATLDVYIQCIVDWGTNKRLQTIESALQALHQSGVRGDSPAPPTISGNEENEDLDNSETNQSYIGMSACSMTHSHADEDMAPEPRQRQSKKRTAETQPSPPKRRKPTGA
ncbi:unnamed protein product [Clonostachys rhizophaga]|uniref:DUF7924 domain-containing protein n=1 Tax=Clonostachys rhizophaga TaxID=160324 RepID=A0A9N9V952_9HYPO|nr:unnamed protein product [Clonostachys rhizophaga]